MARTKTLSDDEVLDAALALMHAGGVGELTFAALAGRCGLSAATLVQRFANKKELVQRTLLHAWDRLDALTGELAATAPPTPAGAIELLVGLSGQYEGAEAYGEGLLLLREDVRDPVLRARGVAWEEALTAALDARLAGEGVGSALAAQWQGSLTWWAFRADRPLGEFLTERLGAFLAMVGEPRT
ncbi:TetR/AcrR family transcriptional regulator [Nonomuraea sp. NPDC050663]|uniref:TetR/AcrR family transcriptional regulator n=1 Tax=Nonomuraea sp. NPDC050663 TaxID=3364370 RepID=UPI0037B7D9AE